METADKLDSTTLLLRSFQAAASTNRAPGALRITLMPGESPYSRFQRHQANQQGAGGTRGGESTSAQLALAATLGNPVSHLASGKVRLPELGATENTYNETERQMILERERKHAMLRQKVKLQRRILRARERLKRKRRDAEEAELVQIFQQHQIESIRQAVQPRHRSPSDEELHRVLAESLHPDSRAHASSSSIRSPSRFADRRRPLGESGYAADKSFAESYHAHSSSIAPDATYFGGSSSSTSQLDRDHSRSESKPADSATDSAGNAFFRSSLAGRSDKKKELTVDDILKLPALHMKIGTESASTQDKSLSKKVAKPEDEARRRRRRERHDRVVRMYAEAKQARRQALEALAAEGSVLLDSSILDVSKYIPRDYLDFLAKERQNASANSQRRRRAAEAQGQSQGQQGQTGPGFFITEEGSGPGGPSQLSDLDRPDKEPLNEEYLLAFEGDQLLQQTKRQAARLRQWRGENMPMRRASKSPVDGYANELNKFLYFGRNSNINSSSPSKSPNATRSERNTLPPL